MRVSREQAAQNRERVLDAAAKLFRERGFSGVGVAELMHAAGLTHGAFYGQFGSKDDLMAEACARAFESSLERWRKAAARSPGDPLAAVVASYLSPSHRDEPGEAVVRGLGPVRRQQMLGGAEIPQDPLPRPQRRRLAVVPAAADTDARAVGAGARRQFLGQAGLAEPGRAADDHQPALAMTDVAQRPEQSAELRGPTDEGRTGCPAM